MDFQVVSVVEKYYNVSKVHRNYNKLYQNNVKRMKNKIQKYPKQIQIFYSKKVRNIQKGFNEILSKR